MRVVSYLCCLFVKWDLDRQRKRIRSDGRTQTPSGEFGGRNGYPEERTVLKGEKFDFPLRRFPSSLTCN